MCVHLCCEERCCSLHQLQGDLHAGQSLELWRRKSLKKTPRLRIGGSTGCGYCFNSGFICLKQDFWVNPHQPTHMQKNKVLDSSVLKLLGFFLSPSRGAVEGMWKMLFGKHSANQNVFKKQSLRNKSLPDDEDSWAGPRVFRVPTLSHVTRVILEAGSLCCLRGWKCRNISLHKVSKR